MTTDPWQMLREHSDIELLWTDDDDYLEGSTGLWFPDSRQIVIDSRLLQVARRCTLAHELAHVVREDGPCDDPRADTRQELAADRMAARWLMPDMEVLAREIRCSSSNGHVAHALWVTLHLFEMRIKSLHPSERARLKALLSEASHTIEGC